MIKSSIDIIKRTIKRNKDISLLFYAIIITLCYGLLFILSEFYDMPCKNFHDFVILAFQWFVIEIAAFGIIYLSCINKYAFSAICPLLLMASTILSYFRYTVHVTFTPMVIDLAMINDIRTSMDVITIWLILLVFISIIVSALLIWLRFRIGTIEHWYLHLVVALAFILIPLNIDASARAISRRMPYSFYFTTSEYLDYQKEIYMSRPEFKDKVHSMSGSIDVVFVLGESARAKNLQINGYSRSTTPFLCQEENIISFPNIYSDYAYTHTSVPHIMTRSDEQHPDRAYTERSFVSIMKKAGFYTVWLANQESVDTFIYFMKECDKLDYINSGKSLYTFDKWLDIDLLPAYDRELRKEGSKKLIILHTIGSHWWYNSHFSSEFEKFKPTITSRVISANSKEEMCNSYDNTILYSDYVWHELINRLRNRNAVLIYLSDHGECLGEDGYFTHAEDRPPLHYPACFVWYSDKFAQKYPGKVNALRTNKEKEYKSYFLFHSILDAADIESLYINKDMDIFYKE